MQKLTRRATVLLATIAMVATSLLVTAPGAMAARGSQTDIPTVYVDLTGNYYRTNVTNPPANIVSPSAAWSNVLGSGSHTIAGSAKFEVVDPANQANSFADAPDCTADPFACGEIRGRGNYTWKTLPNLWRPEMAGWVSNESGGTASFTQAQVDKRAFQFKLSAKRDILGMGSAKTWILLANHADGSLMRNKVAFDLAAEFGLAYTSQSRFVDLVVNGQYLGNYLLAEKVQEGGTRVNITNPSGVLVELDNNYYSTEPSQLVYTSPRGSHFVLKDAYNGNIPDPDANGNVMLPTDVQAGWDDFKQKINWFESLLYAPNPDWSQISLYLDVPSWIKFYFLQEFTENPEIAKSSIYFYKDGINDVFHAGPAWDFDSSLGNYSSDALGGNPNILYTRNILTYRPAGQTASNDYFARLFRMSGFENAAKDLYVKQLKLPVDEASGKLSQYQMLAAQSASKNFAKYAILGRNKLFPPFRDKFSSTWAGEIGRLRSYMTQRAAFLNSIYAPGVAANASDCTATSSSAPIATPGAFNAVTPCRLLDTRTGNGAPKSVVSSGAALPLQITGRGGVPASGVSSVVLNVTVANPTHQGFITAYPDGTPAPDASNLNFAPGQVVPNQVTVKVGANGKIDLKNSVGGTTNLIADLAGYFMDGSVTAPGGFVALDPARILDTRSGIGAPQVTVPANGSIDLTVGGAGGVPADAGAVALNVTVANAAAPGFLTAYPAGVTPVPNASNINFLAGGATPNAVTIKLGTNGKVTLLNTSNGTVDLIADVNGYYMPGTASQPGMFVPLAPARILDTRTGVGMPKGDFKAGTARMLNNYEVLPLKVAGAGGVSGTTAGAVVMNLTVANAIQAGYLTTWPDGSPRPSASSVNFDRWQVVANLATVKIGTTGAVDIYNMSAGQTNVVADVAGYYLK